MKKIIAIIGFNASGKTTVSNYISEKLNLEIHEISGVIKKEALIKKIDITRENLINLALKMAKEEGKQVLAERLLKDIKEKGIIAGMRVPEQLDYIKSNANAIFIGVNTDTEKRFKRMKSRKLYGDPKSLEELIILERQENNPPNVSDTQKCLDKCDFIIDNNGTEKELFYKIDKIINNDLLKIFTGI